MNTITLTPEAYHLALISANKVKTSVEDWVNKVVLSIVASNPTATKVNGEQAAKPATKTRKHYAHDALCGLAMTKSSDEELLDGYLKDKYNI